MGDEYIKRIDVLIKLEIAYDMARVDQKLPISDLQHEVNLIKAADVQPVEHSRWIPMNDGTYNAYCENCGHERGSKAWNKADYKYCPNCGARMDGEQNEDN